MLGSTRLLDFQSISRTLLGKIYYSIEYLSSNNLHLFHLTLKNLNMSNQNYLPGVDSRVRYRAPYVANEDEKSG